MTEAVVARRYAEALLQVCESDEIRDRVLDELSACLDVLDAVPGAFEFLRSPCQLPERKLNVVDEVAKRLELTDTTRHFLDTLVQTGRIELLHSVHDEFRSLVFESRRELEATVRSAQPLSPEQTESIKQALARKTGRAIRLHTEVDPSLLGGAEVRIGHFVLDGSARARLRQLARRLMQ